MTKKPGGQKRIVRLAEIANADSRPSDNARPKHRLPLIDSPPDGDNDDSSEALPPSVLTPSVIPPLVSSSVGTSPALPTALLSTASLPSLAPSAAWPVAVVVSPAASSPMPSPKLSSASPSLAPFSAISTLPNLTTSSAPVPLVPSRSNPSLSSTANGHATTSTTTTTLTNSESFSNTLPTAAAASLSGDISRLVNAITSVKIGDKFSSLLPSKEDLEARAQLTARVSQFYALHCPDQQANANKVAENHFNDVKLLNKKLRAKYGVDLTSLDEPTTSPHTPSATTSTSTLTSAANGETVVIHADAEAPVTHTDHPVLVTPKNDKNNFDKPDDIVAAISDRLQAAENELAEAKEQLETRCCAFERLRVQFEEEKDLRKRLEQQVEAVKSLFEQEALKTQRQATALQELQTANEKLNSYQKELEQECQVSLKSAAESKARAARELAAVQSERDSLASQLHTMRTLATPCDAALMAAIEQHRQLAEREVAFLNEEIVLFRETERMRQESYHNADAENTRAELTALQAKLAAAYQSLEADQETQYAMGEEVLNIQIKMDKMKGEERERVLDTILALSQMKESVDEQVRVKNAEVQSLREQVGELETVCKQMNSEEEAERNRRERGLQTLQRTLDARVHEQQQWAKLLSGGVFAHGEGQDHILSLLLRLVQASSTFLTCLQERRELNNDQEEKAHQQEENRTKQIQSELGELREMLSEAQTGKQRLAAQSSDTIDELRVLVAGMQQELEANQQKKKKLLVLPKPHNFSLSRKS